MNKVKACLLIAQRSAAGVNSTLCWQNLSLWQDLISKLSCALFTGCLQTKPVLQNIIMKWKVTCRAQHNATDKILMCKWCAPLNLLFLHKFLLQASAVLHLSRRWSRESDCEHKKQITCENHLMSSISCEIANRNFWLTKLTASDDSKLYIRGWVSLCLT